MDFFPLQLHKSGFISNQQLWRACSVISIDQPVLMVGDLEFANEAASDNLASLPHYDLFLIISDFASPVCWRAV